MNFVIMFLCEFWGFLRKKGRWIYFFIVLFMIALAVGKDTVGDRYWYVNVYEIENGETFEPIFGLLLNLFSHEGLPFYVFAGVIFILGYSLLTMILFSLTKNYVLVICIYFLFPFILDAEQMRFFIGLCICLAGFLDYARRDRKGIFIASCIASTGFHVSCIMFLIYLFVKSAKKYVLFITAAVCLIMACARPTLSLLPMVAGTPRFNNYFSRINTRKSFVLYAALYLMLIFITIHYNRGHCLLETDDFSGKDIREKRLLIYNVNILSLFFLFLTYFDPNYERMLRFLIVFDYCCLANAMGGKLRKIRISELVILSTLFAFSASRFAAYIFGAGWEVYMKPFYINGFSLF